MACIATSWPVYTEDGPEYREEIAHDNPCSCR